MENALASLCPDGRLRDLFVYGGAHTLRWTSRRVQLQNLTRGVPGLDTPTLLAELSWEAVEAAARRHNVTTADIIGSLLRPTIVAKPGYVLLIADYAAVECRGVAWLAGESALLRAFESGDDVYLQMASRIFGRQCGKADKAERQIGKVVVLGSGYGMGAKKLALFCAQSGVDLEAAGVTAEQCTEAFRDAHPRLAGEREGVLRRGGLWTEYQWAAMRATEHKSIRTAGRCRFVHDGKHLTVTLPSGRSLVYRNARIENVVPTYHAAKGIVNLKPTPVYTGPRGWTTLYGGKIAENITQAVCRDLLATALVRCESPVVLHAHDELVCEVPEHDAEEALKRLACVMSEQPDWADSFPIRVECYASPRYTKSPWPGYPRVEATNGSIT